MKSLLIWSLVGLVFLGGVAMVMIRNAEDVPEDWHVDPLTVTDRGPRNSYLVAPPGVTASAPDADSPRFAMTPEALARAFDEVALSQPRAYRLAGSPQEAWMTYVQRSEVLRFPDYITVKAIRVGAGDDATSALVIYSRSRYGSYDWGVNAARASSWLGQLRARLG